MIRSSMLGACLLVLVLTGCSKSEPVSSTPSPTMDPATRNDPSGEAGALSDEDKALVAKQEICPVGGEKLGSMGTPVKVTVKDRTVFLCCKSCKEAIESDPDKYLAKLDDHAAAPGEASATEEKPAEEKPAEEKPADAPAGDAPATETPAAEAPAEAPAKTE